MPQRRQGQRHDKTDRQRSAFAPRRNAAPRHLGYAAMSAVWPQEVPLARTPTPKKVTRRRSGRCE